MRTRPKQRGNPLRRGSDRFQWWLARLVLAVAVAGLPAAFLAGLAVHHSQTQAVRTQEAARHPVTAHLDADVPENPTVNTVPAPVTWTGTDGAVRTTTVAVEPGRSAGAPVRIWLDARGAVVQPPATAGQAAATAWTAALVTATAVPLTAVLVWKGSLLVLDRRRYARWDTEWRQVEPRWTRRQPS